MPYHKSFLDKKMSNLDKDKVAYQFFKIQNSILKIGLKFFT